MAAGVNGVNACRVLACDQANAFLIAFDPFVSPFS